MRKVLFRVDDGDQIGSGHLMRCLALAEELKQEGCAVYLSSVRKSLAHAEWERIGAIVLIEARLIGSSHDLTQTVGLIKSINADWIVIDGYAFTKNWIESVSSWTRVLFLDDICTVDPTVDIVLNHNPGAENRYSSSYRNCGKLLLGLEWFLLRMSWRNVEYLPIPSHLVLVLGGGDQDAKVASIMRALIADGSAFTADVITSTNYGSVKAQALCAEYPRFFTLRRAPVDLPSLIRRASTVICGAGVTSIEVISLGVTPIILVLADNQKPGAEYLAEKGLAVIAPFDSDDFSETAALALRPMQNGKDEALASEGGCRLLDGNGAARVVAEMKRREYEPAR